MLWHALPHHHIGKCSDDLRTAPSPLGPNHETLPGVLVDQVQQAHGSAIVRPCADEIVAPHMVLVLRPEPHTRSIVEPQSTAWLLLLRYLQPFATPDAFDPVFAHPPARLLQHRRDPAVAVAPVLAGKFDHSPGECILVFARCRSVALRAAWLVHQSARTSLTQPM